jgi:hypothetical protein
MGGARRHHHAVAGRDRHRAVGFQGEGRGRAAVETAGRPGARQGAGLQHRHRLAQHSRRPAGGRREARGGRGLYRHQGQDRLQRGPRPEAPGSRAPRHRPVHHHGRPTATASGTCPPASAFAAPPRPGRLLDRRAALARRREGPRPAGARHQHPGGAGRAALHARRIRRIFPPGGDPLGAARRDAHGRHHRGAAGLRHRAFLPACRWRRMRAT